ncbi:hypothetical protein FSARC_8481 [Fusarium sarcochroum]|uniref:Lysine-specific metallo-endopeptidase domain-containing protein n=1 Tax=Fusarium sarcochroum TaxID=1208366 RepID=A0A8H4X761_9HYPO|nr:hypothetical protein FSARC_8481 [Fusarium sarcochroum]
MRPANLFKSLVGFLAFEQCRAAVAWYSIGCEGETVAGDSIDDIWDSAVALSSNAQSVIKELNSVTKVSARSDDSPTANNARYLWGISFRFLPELPLPKAAKETLQKVSDDSGVWYAELPSSTVPSKDEEKDLLILRFTSGGSGQTFMGRIQVGKEEKKVIPGILLCANRMRTDEKLKKKKGVLTLNYDVPGENPNPDDFSSAAGTILHEMVHAIDTNTYQDQRDPIFKGQAAYGFSRCYYMAKERLEDAFKNPDNYAVFAEMCMSPETRWKMPQSPG